MANHSIALPVLDIPHLSRVSLIQGVTTGTLATTGIAPATVPSAWTAIPLNSCPYIDGIITNYVPGSGTDIASFSFTKGGIYKVRGYVVFSGAVGKSKCRITYFNGPTELILASGSPCFGSTANETVVSLIDGTIDASKALYSFTPIYFKYYTTNAGKFGTDQLASPEEDDCIYAHLEITQVKP
jgi:hypothetical protein